jgi:ribosomal protein S18 acetylase RimI-like enzyme
MKAGFRRVAGSEIDDAYATYLGVFEWLHAKGVRHWLRALSREAFVELQRRGELFAYYLDDGFAAVVTLAFENSLYWSGEIGGDRHWWIKSLAVARRCRDAGVGKQVMQESEALIRGGELRKRSSIVSMPVFCRATTRGSATKSLAARTSPTRPAIHFRWPL